MSGRIEWVVREEIGILTINNPPENYLVEPEFVPLARLQQWTSASELKGILIHGKGRHFSAGADLKRLFEIIATDDHLEAKLSAGNKLIDHLVSTNLPLVAAIQGVCFGGGLEIALACTIRVAAENALFAAPETSFGLIPGLGGTFRLPDVIGNSQALQMILTGDLLSAEEALRINLVDFIVPRKELFPYSFAMIRRMTKNLSPRIIRSVMETLRNCSSLSQEQAISEETRLFCELAKEEYIRRLSEAKSEK